MAEVRHLRRARDLADARYAEGLDVAVMARQAHASRAHFIRSFTATYGETPMRYVARRRVERAQDLLRTANLTVTEIAFAVGFHSLGSFSSRFKELVGVSPSEYRRRHPVGVHHIPGCFLFMRGVDSLQPMESSTPGEVHEAPECLR